MKKDQEDPEQALENLKLAMERVLLPILKWLSSPIGTLVLIAYGAIIIFLLIFGAFFAH